MLAAMEIEVGSTSTKFVLVKLADNANDKGECWPSYDTIARITEMSKRSAINHIQKLEDIGLITKEIRSGVKGNSSNMYRLHLDGEKSAPPIEFPALASENSAPHGEISAPPSADFAPPPSAKSAPESVSSLEPVIESVIESKKHVREIIPLSAMFDKFFAKYPNRTDRKKAYERFIKINPTDEQFDLMMLGLDNQIKWRDEKPPREFVAGWKLPTTWLNGENWNDELKPWVYAIGDNVRKSTESNAPALNVSQSTQELVKRYAGQL